MNCSPYSHLTIFQLANDSPPPFPSLFTLHRAHQVHLPDFTLHEGLGPKSGTGSYQKDKKDGRGGRGRSASGVSGSGVIDIGWWEFERMETLRGQLMEIQTAHGAPAESKGGERAAPFRDDGDD